jgi:uncharacterized protein YaaN involved in tellurite resistance
MADVPASDARTARIAEISSQIDITSANSIINFGSGAQGNLQTLSQSMLEGVRTKDVGPAGDSLANMVTVLRGFVITEGDGRSKLNFFERLFGKMAPVAKLMAKFETVRGQIDEITDTLMSHENALMRDINMLDKLYEKTLEFYQELGLYIVAGDTKIKQIDTEDIPAFEARLEGANEQDQIMFAQELRDLRSAREDLERRVHDLKLTRQVTMQSLPSIRLVQENDKSLVTKIASTLNNTVPLWETQLAQALTIQRSSEAAQAVRSANDLTNELLTANAQNLRQANTIVRTEMERGIFDINAVKEANASLIATIEESLTITQEGKTKRREAEEEMEKMESELRDALSKSKAPLRG